MEIGYIGFYEFDIFDEIPFAKENFDYYEVNLRPELDYSEEEIEQIKENTKGLKLVGHVFWDIDLSQNDKHQKEMVFKTLDIFENLGINKAVIHPSKGDRKDIDKIKEKNYMALREILEYSKERGILLCVENVGFPFADTKAFKEILKEVPGIQIALDTGHIMMVSEEELEKFVDELKEEIKHIHLHDYQNGMKHLFFEDRNRVKNILKKLKDSGYDGTVTLEGFSINENGKQKILDGNMDERKKRFLQELKMVRDILNRLEQSKNRRY